VSSSFPERSVRRLTRLVAALTAVLLIAGCSGGSGTSDTVDPTQNPVPRSITVQTAPAATARVGPILGVRVGEVAILDGSRSTTTSDDVLTYEWTFTSKPDASATVLQDSDTEAPSFIPDARGTYVIQLVVRAGTLTSRRAIALVVATEPPEPDAFHQGLSAHCVNCHNEDFPDIPAKVSTHVATSNNCETCHTPLGFTVITRVDHQEVFGNCSQCHNGVLAIGKSEFHVATTQECGDCHNTEHFLMLNPDGSFDHSGILRSCSGCHNDTIAIGKTPSPPHPVTDSECGECHTTATFADPFPDHSGPDVLNNRCDSCHGVNATGQTVGHPVTNVDCGVCHTTTSFSMGGVFNHRLVDASVQPCTSCHNDTNSIGAPGKSPGHPVTNEDCGVCHNTDSFALGVFDHTGIVDNCASCHGVTATGMSPNHMPTLEDCSVCHTPGTFTTGTYDHAGVTSGCETCHDNVIAVGKLANHLPTTEDCSVCHDTVDFRGAVFDHMGIDTSNCALCHDGTISPGKPAGHVPTMLDCSDCHDIGNYTSFAGITFSHAGIDPDNCAACHATGIATPKAVDHIPAQNECSLCHQNTDSFMFSSFLVAVHPDITDGCEGCHTPAFFPPDSALVKAVNHLPTQQDCDLCHMNTTFAPSIFDHVGISGNCASCHDGSSAFVALGARGEPATPIHQNTTGDCSICHNTSAFADAFVDHSGPEVTGSRCDSCHNGVDATGKDAKPDHVITTQDCGVCHVPGGTFAPAIFNHDGITDNCASCHNGIDATGKDAKVNPPHIPTNEDCSVCHTPTSFANAHFNHQGIVDNCASCHNGTTATGKASTHVPTDQDCSVCHFTTGFLPATFDHTGIVDNCASCHDAGFATGKPRDHVATSEDCGVCHTPVSFVPATFDHTGIVDNCASCHGVTAQGMSPDHIPTTLDCSNCHTTTSFAGATFDHQGITDGCSVCHDGVTATGSEPQGLNAHFITTAECEVCHTPQGWAPIDFTHAAASDYPGNHARNPGCRQCHDDNDENITYPYPQYAPYCASCHANSFRRVDKHNGGSNGTVEQNKDCSGGGRGCHSVNSRTWN